LHICAQLTRLDIELAALCVECYGLRLHDIEVTHGALPVLAQREIDRVLGCICRLPLLAKRAAEVGQQGKVSSTCWNADRTMLR